MKPVHEIRRENLAKLRDLVGGSWAELNRRTGRSSRDATFTQIWKQSVNSRTGVVRQMGGGLARSLEKQFSKPDGWMDADHTIGDNFQLEERSTAKPVPIISFVRASGMDDISDPFQPGEADDWIVPSARTGEGTFALVVNGPSMLNPHGLPSFPEGSVIIVDPTASPDAGKYVIAKDVEHQQATFKRLVQDGNKWFLQPLNPAFPTIEIDRNTIRIIGVVVEVVQRTRL